MVNISRIILDGLLLSVIVSVFITLSMRLAPRIWLHDYPRDIQALVPPKTEKEKRLSWVIGIPFMILLVAVPLISTFAVKAQDPGEIPFFSLAIHAFGVVWTFNVVDWLVLDWLMFCTITPKFVVIPGSEGAAGYKDYGFHFRGFLKGTIFSAAAGLIIGAIVWFL